MGGTKPREMSQLRLNFPLRTIGYIANGHMSSIMIQRYSKSLKTPRRRDPIIGLEMEGSTMIRVAIFISSFEFSELQSMKNEGEFLDRVAEDMDELESAVAEFYKSPAPLNLRGLRIV
ncbi:hypothetical protein MMC16_005571 [Acarospora aff. strigata]|nr:hypothetical protein [Acarospora aff. strigata]